MANKKLVDLIQERAELMGKLVELNENKDLHRSFVEKNLIGCQMIFMHGYLTMLEARIQLLKEKKQCNYVD